MINRDKFDALEGVWADQNLLTHLGLSLLVFGLSLGVESGITYSRTQDATAFSILVVCIGATIIGLVLGGVGLQKRDKYKNLRKSLFDDQHLISDETILLASDGSKVRIDNLNQGEGLDSQSKLSITEGTQPKIRRG